ncbi:hypothetical protein [Halorhodospira neutriphila]|uniref:Uncharacterized protein n=1 Tax=Halorhodospira neutriphila TaxID=168379 RepID=A0ABS1E3L3_9GAMM|nr:hypothetical protein [Halorhodospira neutriphila]MBK1725824.1 hypothetical protein [Halorhodospira neutriphila]
MSQAYRPRARHLLLLLGAALLLAAPAAGAEPKRAPFILDLSGTGYEREGLDELSEAQLEAAGDQFLGAGLGVRGYWGGRFHYRARLERLEEYDAEHIKKGVIERLRVALGVREPLAPRLDAVYELELGYFDYDIKFPRTLPAALGIDEERVSSAYTEGGVQIGVTGHAEHWRTDLRAVLRLADDADVRSQVGGRAQVTGFSANRRYAGYAEVEWLSDEEAVRLGFRRLFH